MALSTGLWAGCESPGEAQERGSPSLSAYGPDFWVSPEHLGGVRAPEEEATGCHIPGHSLADTGAA